MFYSDLFVLCIKANLSIFNSVTPQDTGQKEISKLWTFQWWIQFRETYSGYVLGPNIQQEFYTPSIPTLSDTTDIRDDEGNPCFWAVTGGYMQLSIYCNWRFLNLNKAFELRVAKEKRSIGKLDFKESREELNDL